MNPSSQTQLAPPSNPIVVDIPFLLSGSSSSSYHANSNDTDDADIVIATDQPRATGTTSRTATATSTPRRSNGSTPNPKPYAGYKTYVPASSTTGKSVMDTTAVARRNGAWGETMRMTDAGYAKGLTSSNNNDNSPRRGKSFIIHEDAPGGFVAYVPQQQQQQQQQAGYAVAATALSLAYQQQQQEHHQQQRQQQRQEQQQQQQAPYLLQPQPHAYYDPSIATAVDPYLDAFRRMSASAASAALAAAYGGDHVMGPMPDAWVDSGNQRRPSSPSVPAQEVTVPGIARKGIAQQSQQPIVENIDIAVEDVRLIQSKKSWTITATFPPSTLLSDLYVLMVHDPNQFPAVVSNTTTVTANTATTTPVIVPIFAQHGTTVSRAAIYIESIRIQTFTDAVTGRLRKRVWNAVKTVSLNGGADARFGHVETKMVAGRVKIVVGKA
ncbi:hypothetical protein DFJ77DRAFT_443138 [Powellomyces hirtus]|nr:hypothetical protein DFJ77DRAFT_443138 [Powellomyces hirtus]